MVTPKPHFRVLGFPVRVSPSFLILIAILGIGGGTDPVALAMWIAIAFLSILLHELGHAIAARAFGRAPSIEFHALGGLTHLGSGPPITPARDLVISLAGPAVSLAIGGAAFAYAASSHAPAEGSFLELALDDVLYANLGWGLFNLCPILPLDGGHAFRAVLTLLRRRDPELIARIVSLVALTALAVLVIHNGGGIWSLLFLANFAFANGRALRDHLQRPAPARARGIELPRDASRASTRGLLLRMKLWLLRRQNGEGAPRVEVDPPPRSKPASRVVVSLEEELLKRRPPKDKRFLN